MANRYEKLFKVQVLPSNYWTIESRTKEMISDVVGFKSNSVRIKGKPGEPESGCWRKFFAFGVRV